MLALVRPIFLTSRYRIRLCSLAVSSSIRHDQQAELSRIAQIRQNAVSALLRLQREATAPACSRLFFAQLQTVAFLPDGLNEFLYAPHGIVKCSTS